mmetsp:Transcript_82969/g.231495  ORF Transcript_82969/g.231495 Transcript_82969/m.231495 type:complete len:206 (+) Transcript_82969:790-1407(+)
MRGQSASPWAERCGVGRHLFAWQPEVQRNRQAHVHECCRQVLRAAHGAHVEGRGIPWHVPAPRLFRRPVPGVGTVQRVRGGFARQRQGRPASSPSKPVSGMAKASGIGFEGPQIGARSAELFGPLRVVAPRVRRRPERHVLQPRPPVVVCRQSPRHTRFRHEALGVLAQAAHRQTHRCWAPSRGAAAARVLGPESLAVPLSVPDQ